jgi:hypothetical protein
MSSIRLLVLYVVVAGLALLGSAPSSHGAGGGVLNNPRVLFTTDRPGQPGETVGAQVELQSILFKLNAVQGKYKVLPLLVENRGPEPIVLSRSDDTFMVLFEGRSVPGILQLSKVDRELWDSLDSSTQRMLSYPEQIGRNEAVMIYVFVKEAELPGMPQGFDYTVKSVGRTFTLRTLPPKLA